MEEEREAQEEEELSMAGYGVVTALPQAPAWLLWDERLAIWALQAPPYSPFPPASKEKFSNNMVGHKVSKALVEEVAPSHLKNGENQDFGPRWWAWAGPPDLGAWLLLERPARPLLWDLFKNANHTESIT